jgi:imidazolonepropionase-like amidohydrolase
MKLDPKDLVGVAVFLGALSVVVIHNGPFGHPAGHRVGVADAGGSVTAPVGEPATAFVDFNVVPMDRDVVLVHQTVLVRGRRIEQVGDVASVEIPRGARIVEGHGSLFLAPGLTDTHVHLRDTYETWLPLFVAYGVTSVFNLEGRPSHLALRRRIATGEQPGPSIYTAGRYVTGPEVRSAADARSEVARQASRGYDFVKLHGDLSAEAYRSLTEAGQDLDIPVVGHAPRNLPFSEVLEGGQVALSHAEEIIQTELRSLDPQSIASLADRVAESGMWIMPTLSHFDAVASQWGSLSAVEAVLASEAAAYLPEGLRREWRQNNVFLDADTTDRERVLEMADFHRPLVRALHDAGVPLLAGTDTPIPTQAPGSSLLLELEALRDAGLSGYDALVTATVNPGRFVRTHVDAGAHFGIIERGARADLVMLGADPRRDLGTLRLPEGVMVRGAWYERTDLDRLREGVAGSR